ncbi:MAG: CPBP family intramembrane metalloprotease [Anaerolineaceae bacterium]|nr:CPBP family intramembrane metalloprotease [Anaerolineaceae bacterium]
MIEKNKENHIRLFGRFQLFEHPWLSLVIHTLITVMMIILVIIFANGIGIPGNSPYRPLITPALAHVITLFIVTPFVLHLPNGKTTFKQYLKDIRLSNLNPIFPILILGLSASLFMLLILSTHSILFRFFQGLPLDQSFWIRVISDLKGDLPPESQSWLVAFPAVFEEVGWRGVLLVLFMRKYSKRNTIIITALGFGLLHFVNLIFGGEPSFVVRQVIFGTSLGFFYGFLVLRTNSLLPAMIFHFLVNMFIGSFTWYFQQTAPAGTQILYTLITLPFASWILIQWTKIFCNKWIPSESS